MINCQFYIKSQTRINNPLTIQFELTGASWCNDYHDFYKTRLNKSYSILYGQIKLKNQTDSIFSFWIMNCSWTDLFIANPDSILIMGTDCDNNQPHKITLKKGQTIIFNSRIGIPTNYLSKSTHKFVDSYGNSYNSFKIGFLLLTEDEYDRGDYWRETINDKMKKNNFIWTDPIKIRYINNKWRIE